VCTGTICTRIRTTKNGKRDNGHRGAVTVYLDFAKAL